VWSRKKIGDDIGVAVMNVPALVLVGFAAWTLLTLFGSVGAYRWSRRRTNGPGSQPPHWLQLMIKQAEITNESTRFHEAKVEEVMTRDPLTVTEDTPIAEACRLIEERGIKRLPVVRDGRLVGVVARADLVRALGIAVRRITHADERATRAEALTAKLQVESMMHRSRSGR
jgi:CBS domain-containing protein